MQKNPNSSENSKIVDKPILGNVFVAAILVPLQNHSRRWPTERQSELSDTTQRTHGGRPM